MTKGRPRLSREQLALRGTLRKDRERPSSVIGSPIKPEEIGARCQTSGLKAVSRSARDLYWGICRRIAPIGILQEQDCPQLLRYAVYLDLWFECCRRVREDGMFMTRFDKEGNEYTVPNPAIIERNRAEENLRKIESNFGMTPIDRQRLKAQAEEPKAKGIKAIFAAMAVMDQDIDEQ